MFMLFSVVSSLFYTGFLSLTSSYAFIQVQMVKMQQTSVKSDARFSM